MEVIGYKCFNEDLSNRYKVPFEVGKTYEIDGDVKFGNDGNGFHFCKNIEDTLRYFDTSSCSICLVKGSGKVFSYDDDYNGFYDMYVAEKIEIIKKLSREEIIDIGLNLYDYRLYRFIQLFKLSCDEIEQFKEKFSNDKILNNYIDYYQLGNNDAFKTR